VRSQWSSEIKKADAFFKLLFIREGASQEQTNAPACASPNSEQGSK